MAKVQELPIKLLKPLAILYSPYKAIKLKQTDVITNTIEKQPPEVFFTKRCSFEIRKIDRKTPVPESFFNKVADQSL